MLRSRAPLRISFGGGGTDIEPYASRHGGLAFNVTIDRYTYCILGDFKNGEFEERLKKGVHEELGLPERDFGLMLLSESPAGAGLGSSSSLMVAVVKAIAGHWGMGLSKYELAEVSYRLERELLQVKGGRQDQYASSFGGFNFMEFGSPRVVTPLRLDEDVSSELHANLMLVDTLQTRTSSNIVAKQIASYEKEDSGVIDALKAIKEITVMMKSALMRGELDRFGLLLSEEWAEKKKLAVGISNPLIERIHMNMIKAGATGGKLLGAGGGGHLLFLVPPEKRLEVELYLADMGLRPTHFGFDLKGATSWKA